MSPEEKMLASYLWLYIKRSNTNAFLPYNLPWFRAAPFWSYVDVCKKYADGVDRCYTLSFEQTIAYLQPQYRELAQLLILEYQMSIL